MSEHEAVSEEPDAEAEGVYSGDGVSAREFPHAQAAPPEGSIDDLAGASSLRQAYRPKAGDRCVVDGVLAEIVTYDEAANLYSAERQVGNSIDRVTDHISNARFEPLSDGSHVISTDGLDAAQAESNTVHSPEQETIDEGLARTTASQGNRFTALSQQRILAQQPHAGDSQELAVDKQSGDVDLDDAETPSDSESVDDSAPAEQTDSASADQAQGSRPAGEAQGSGDAVVNAPTAEAELR